MIDSAGQRADRRQSGRAQHEARDQQPQAFEAPVEPFSTVTISDLAPNPIETVTIQVTGGGTLADGAGFSGLTASATPGLYDLAAASPTAVTAEIDALVFTPVGGPANTRSTSTFTLTDQAGGTAKPVSAAVQVTDIDPAIAPTISGGLGAQLVPSLGALTPWSAVRHVSGLISLS